jgi:REP element-mobilizing transposase RayT
LAIAIFTTWTTYGTWLPGDRRGWYERDCGVQLPDRIREYESALRMSESAITLDTQQRQLVEKTIAEHCGIRKWFLHAMNCRTNHVHVLVTAPDRTIEIPREQFKSWCTRKLKVRTPRENWWTERGWDEFIDDEEGLNEVMAYITECQSC